MFIQTKSHKQSFAVKVMNIVLIALFSISVVAPNVHAQSVNLPTALPVLGRMIGLTNAYTPALVKGLLVHPEHPFKFDFLMDPGDSGLKGEALKSETMKQIKYFLAALTVPENDMWVNLSPSDWVG